MKIILVLALFVLNPTHWVFAEEHPGEPPVLPPYPEKLDPGATRDWWNVARSFRAGKTTISKKHSNKRLSLTGRSFLDLEAPRDEVVAFALYTVHDQTLKMTAQLYPLFPKETRTVRLEIREEDVWKQIATSEVNDLGWSALFRIENWDDSRDVPYRVLHGESASFEGLIRKNPIDQETIVVGSLSCNATSNQSHRKEIVRSLKALDPDLLFFAGDQHYEHEHHTSGWLLWGLQFRDVLRDRPTITIPDDHDVGQGNLWGEGGIPSKGRKGDSGGYVYHPEYVNQVQRCQTAHLPDPVDPTPVAQGIGVYFTHYTLGGIDFAILEDRKFKSGPKGKIQHSNKRPDHVIDLELDPLSLDMEGLTLLGERQLNFLETWATEWEGVEMKAVLSQTPLFGGSHLHGRKHERILMDLDSNGWPQTGRNKALQAIRKSFSPHLAGDQHLATLAQHGVDEYNDGPWSLVSPSIIGIVYSRKWHPVEEAAGANADSQHPLPWTGEYLDGFHNKVTMHAYANPDSPIPNSGYVIARFHKTDRTITAECWPGTLFAGDPEAQQFPGWPKVIPQLDNYNPPSWGGLGELIFDVEDPVVQLVQEETGEILYTLRIKGKTFTPHAPRGESFIIKAGEHSADQVVQSSAVVGSEKSIMVKLK